MAPMRQRLLRLRILLSPCCQTALYEHFVEGDDRLGKDFSAMLPRFEKRGWL
jgi:hypothetical protein